MGLVPAPAGGLNGNSNYYVYGGGNPILSLTVTIKITTDIYAPYGCSFQLNCDSSSNPNMGSQQYCFDFDAVTNVLSASIDNWPTPAFAASLNTQSAVGLINAGGPLLTLTGQNGRLPAGTTLTVTLGTGAGGIVQGVTFTATVGQGQPGTYSTPLEALPAVGANPPQAVPLAALQPISAAQLNLVGKDDGQYTYLNSGAGTITYSATGQMTVVNSRPSGVAGGFTQEQANSIYGQLDAGPSTSFTQTFQVNLAGPMFLPGWALAASQQIGLNQTDVFAINKTGQLSVFYVVESGHWQEAGPFGPFCMANMGTSIAVSQQFGCDNQTDVFLIDQQGTLQVLWVNGAGAWGGPKAISNGGVAFSGAPVVASQQFGANNQTNVFFFDHNGQLNIFWVQNAGAWNGPVLVGPPNVTVSAARLAVSQQFGVNQTDVFVIDKTGALNVYYAFEPGGAWTGPQKIGPAGLAPPGGGVAAGQQIGGNNQTDVFLIDNSGQLNVFWVNGQGNWNQPLAIGPTGVAPAGASLAVSQQFGLNQTCVFVVDNSGTLNVYWVEGTGSWNGPKKIGPAGIAPPGSPLAACQQFGVARQTDVFFINQAGTNGPGWPMVSFTFADSSWTNPKALVTEV
jgi:hypothetical protein